MIENRDRFIENVARAVDRAKDVARSNAWFEAATAPGVQGQGLVAAVAHLHQNNGRGYVYALFNRAFQNGLLKIGMTRRTPEERAQEISTGTGLPATFEVLYYEHVTDCERAERLLHERLKQFRTSSNREFFHIDAPHVVRALAAVADEVGRVDDDSDESMDETVAAVENQAAQPIDAENAPSTLGEITAMPLRNRKRPPMRSAEARPTKATARSVSFDDLASYTDDVVRPILFELRLRLFRLDARLRETERCTPYNRIAYRVPGHVIFLEVKVQRAALVLHLADGGAPDPQGIADDIPESHGWRQLKKRIAMTSMADLDASWPFIESAYRVYAT